MSLFRKKVTGAPGGKDRRKRENREMRRQFEDNQKKEAIQLLEQARQLTDVTNQRLKALEVQKRVMRRQG